MYQIKNLVYGVISGLLGGIVFAVLLMNLDKLKELGEVVHITSSAGELVIHLLVSAFIGLTFAFIFQKLIKGLTAGWILGIVYGIIWWFIVPITLVPYYKGLAIDSSWNAAAITASMMPLVEYIVFGFIMGIAYGFFKGHPLTRSSV